MSGKDICKRDNIALADNFNDANYTTVRRAFSRSGFSMPNTIQINHTYPTC